jgi:hypothetical protein
MVGGVRGAILLRSSSRVGNDVGERGRLRDDPTIVQEEEVASLLLSSPGEGRGEGRQRQRH